MDLELVLQGLRDIHIPEPVSIWPLAPIWWIILLLVLASIIYSLGKKAQQRLRYTDVALEALNEIRKQHRQHQSNAKTCAALSKLVRQIALATDERADVANITGQAWLSYLDDMGKTTEFTEGIGRTLLTSPYQKSPSVDVSKLFKFIRRWIKQTEKARMS